MVSVTPVMFRSEQEDMAVSVTVCPFALKLLPSKNTSSVEVGTLNPPVPPVVSDQCAVSDQSPVPPIQYLPGAPDDGDTDELGEVLLLGEVLALIELDGLRELDGLTLALALLLGDTEAEIELDGLIEALGLVDADMLLDGLVLAEIELDGEPGYSRYSLFM